MLVKKADDYQSWYIEEDGYGILIDPWLDYKLNPRSSFFLQRKRNESHSLKDEELKRVRSIIITAPFADHLHEPSIKCLGSEKIIYSTKIVKKILRRRRFNNDFKLVENTNKIGPLNFSSLLAGFPYCNTAFSFLLSNNKGKSLYHEGHIVNLKQLKKNNIKSDIAIITAESVKLLGLIRLSMHEKKTLEVLNALDSKKLMVTGSSPFKTKGLVDEFLQYKPLDASKFEREGIRIFNKSGDKTIL